MSWRRVSGLAGIAAAGAGLLPAYLFQSRTQAVNADGASNALQAWDMLHGDLLLHGWSVTYISFYPVELSQYALIEAVRGLRPDVVHVGAAVTYTLLVLLAAWLAKGRASGREGVVRALLAGGIMLAPQLGNGTYTLLLSPDHVGTAALVLGVWLVIDRYDASRFRWYLPPVVLVLLTLAMVGDMLAVVTAAVPLAAVCGVRVLHGVARRREPLRAQWYELSLALMAGASVAAASWVTRLIAEHGGWTLTPIGTRTAGSAMLPGNARLTGEGLLELFGADFTGLPMGRAAFFAFAHLAGVALVAWALWLAVRRYFTAGLLVQVLVAAIVVNVAAYVFSLQAHDIHSTREIAAVLPFGAVLAGRLLAGKPLTGRPAGIGLAAVLLAVSGCYAAMLGCGAAQPPVPAENSDLTAWLAAHHLTSGLGGYWQANSVTLDSSDVIKVRAIEIAGNKLTAESRWDASKAWYDPAVGYADFVVTANSPGPESDQNLLWRMAAKVGWPVRVYHVGRYTIAVWNQNLLRSLG